MGHISGGVGSYVVDGDIVVRRQVDSAFDSQKEEKLTFRLKFRADLLSTDLLDRGELIWDLSSVRVEAFHLDFGY